MLADLKAKAKNGKKQPSFEIVDVSEAERLRGEQVAAYQAKKAKELQQRRGEGQQRSAHEEQKRAHPKPTVELMDSIKSQKITDQYQSDDDNDDEDDGDEDRDDPFASDVTSEEDDDDMMPERADLEEEKTSLGIIQQEFNQQERDITEAVNAEIALSGSERYDALGERDIEMPSNLEDYIGDQAYQMY